MTIIAVSSLVIDAIGRGAPSFSARMTLFEDLSTQKRALALILRLLDDTLGNAGTHVDFVILGGLY